MKLHIIYPFLSRSGGGIYTVIRELYNNKIFKSYKSFTLNYWGYEDKFSISDTKILKGKVNLYKIHLTKINKLQFSKAFQNAIFKEVKANDIIHLHSLWLYLSYLATQLQNKKKAKKIISVHGMLNKWALENGTLKKKIVWLLFEKTNILTANCVHALCEKEYIDIRKIVKNVPVAVIPNGVNLPSIKYNSDLNFSAKKLLFLGRLHPIKGLDNLLNAWSTLNIQDWELIIAGPDEINHKKTLIKLSKKLNIEKSVQLIGPKFGMEKDNLLSNVDAFILPSHSEGLPMSILEAWSYKLPVVMTPECNLPDGFESNSAISINPDIDSIIQGLKEFFQ